MKAIRNIINIRKELISFWLLLFFLTSFNAANIVSFFEDVRASNIHHVEKGKYIVSEAVDESVLSSLQLKDSDIDDIEFTYYGHESSEKTAVLPAEQHNFVQETQNYTAYKVPLYDLYCNWKFHLS